MRSPSRRDVIRLGAIGAGTLAAARHEPARGRRCPDADPHFFLLIVLDGGADPSYMFDARPLSMTRAGKIQNYLGEEPGVWTGSNGVGDARHPAGGSAARLPRPFQRAQRCLHDAELRRPSAEHELPVLGQSVRRRFLHPAPQLRRHRPRAGIARRDAADRPRVHQRQQPFERRPARAQALGQLAERLRKSSLLTRTTSSAASSAGG